MKGWIKMDKHRINLNDIPRNLLPLIAWDKTTLLTKNKENPETSFDLNTPKRIIWFRNHYRVSIYNKPGEYRFYPNQTDLFIETW